MSDFVLSQTDGRPMYLQIIDQVQQRVAVGDWAPGSKLPSIRELASKLSVSIITVKRAYLELERSGVIVTQQGIGSRVADGLEPSAVAHEELQRLVSATAELARSIGVGKEELIALLASQLEDQ